MPCYSVLPAPQETSASAEPSSQYWNVNVPESEWTNSCPNFLLNQSDKNVGILSSKNEEAQIKSWADVQRIVRTNSIDRFQRTPIELRRYLEFCYESKREYGSVWNFVQEKRLCWKTVTPSSDVPFTSPEDYKILYNDWPYAIEPDVSHLVVWTKFLIEDDPVTDDMTDESMDMLEEFVKRTFCDEMPRAQVVWFKNWRRLRSIHALEHFHVMLFKAPKEFLAKVTEGDQPVSKNLG